ncbi:MAG TPA: hypothetical protein VJK51_03550 [Candidatus Nanoarchaeia archaeon]|nr:hypothetical protein [Candidatus Nanoarchaeia archaeon]
MVNKRGQLTLILIVGIALVAVLLVFFLYPRIKTTTTSAFTPTGFLESCLEPAITPALDIVTKQGGSMRPEGFFLYGGEKVQYLCYTSDYYKTCVVQQPFVKNQVEQELTVVMQGKTRECMGKLKEEYESRGYQVSGGTGSSQVAFIPGSMNIEMSAPLSVSKGEEKQNFKGFTVKRTSELYDLLLLSSSIVEYESTLGDSEVTLFMQYYPDLKIEKMKLSDGTKIYTLTNVVTNERFRFASRSLSWPPGYGVDNALL